MFGTVDSVELLVRARAGWRPNKPLAEWTKKDAKDFWRTTQRGEIIVVKPDDWKWGSREQPPRYVVIKVPAATVDQAKSYLYPLLDTVAIETSGASDSTYVKERSVRFRKAVVDLAMTLWEDGKQYLTLTKLEVKAAVLLYDLATIKEKIKNKLDQ